MPQYDYKSIDTKCPFYIREDRFCIVCEGCLGDGNQTAKFWFLTVKEKELQKKEWCNKNYKKCEYYNCIIKNKYPEE